MPEFVKKMAFGRYKETGTSMYDPEVSHVIFSVKEFKSADDQLRKTLEAKKVLEKNIDSETEKLQKYHAKEMQKLKDALKEERLENIRQLINNKNNLQKEYETKLQEKDAIIKEKDIIIKEKEKARIAAIELNKNYDRMHCQKANKDRGLPQSAPGYVFTMSTEIKDRVPDPNSPAFDPDYIEVRVWRTNILTPMPADCVPYSAQYEIMNTLRHDIFPQIGVDAVQASEDNGTYRIPPEDSFEFCDVYRWQFKINYKTGFYEVEVYHTAPFSVPEKYLPARNEKTKKGTPSQVQEKVKKDKDSSSQKAPIAKKPENKNAKKRSIDFNNKKPDRSPVDKDFTKKAEEKADIDAMINDFVDDDEDLIGGSIDNGL